MADGQTTETTESAPAASSATSETTSAPASESPAAGVNELRDDVANVFEKLAKGKEDKSTETATKVKGAAVKEQAAAAKPAEAHDEEPAAPEEQDDKEEQETTPKAPTTRPPAGWGAAAKAAWKDLPPAVQSAALKREVEHRALLKRAIEGERVAQGFQGAIQPYLGMIQAEGSTPERAVSNLLQTAAALRTAPLAHKAGIVASMMRTYGITEEALAGALDDPSAPAPQAPAGPMPGAAPMYQDPRVDQLLQGLQAQEEASVQEDLDAFLDTPDGTLLEPDHMIVAADLLEASARRGQKMTVAEAAQLALQADPEARSVLEQRRADEALRKKAKAAEKAAAKAKAASSSVRSTPGTSTKKTAVEGDDWKSALAANWDALQVANRIG